VSIRVHRTGEWSLARIFPPIRGPAADWKAFDRVRSEMQKRYSVKVEDEQLVLPFEASSGKETESLAPSSVRD